MTAPYATTLRKIAVVTACAFLAIVLGTNSVAAAGGPLTWLTIWRLPAAGGEFAGVGPVSLLPMISAVCYALYLWRMPAPARPRFIWGTPRITLPALALWLWAIGRGASQCFDGPCPRGILLRLIVLGVAFFWAYLLIANERPDLLWVVAPVLVVQSAVAVGQFVAQHDLGLRLLGEVPLDPAVSGIVVVMNGDVRWLRGYGLTNDPSILARMLVLCLLMLPIVARGSSGVRRVVAVVALCFGLAGVVVTLSRWGWACLLLGLVINAVPVAARFRQSPAVDRRLLRGYGLAAVAFVVVLGLFLAQYGNAVYGRFFDLDNPLEMGSLLVRARDMNAGLQIWQGAPLTGVGPDNYQSAAVAVLPAAALDSRVPIVTSVPVRVAAELGLVGLALWCWLGLWPLWRRGALTSFAPFTALWLAFFALGLFGVGPSPLHELRSALLMALAAGLVAQSWALGRKPTAPSQP